MLLEKAAAYHVVALRAEGRAASTISLYSLVHKTFINYVSTVLGQPATLAAFTVTTVRDFQAWLRDRPARTANAWQRDRSVTVRQFTKVLKTWSRLLASDLEDLFPSGDPLAKLAYPKATSPLPRVVRGKEFETLVAFCGKTQRPARNEAILKVFYDSGIRNAELCGIQLADVELAQRDRDGSVQNGRILIHGKGGRERHVGLGLEASRSVAAYLKHDRGIDLERPERSHPRDESPWLFLGVRDRPMTPDAVRHVLQVLCALSGLPRIHPHALRTTFGTDHARAGLNAFALKAQMGHQNIAQTSRYVQLADADIADTYTSLLDHPSRGPVQNRGNPLGTAARSKRD